MTVLRQAVEQARRRLSIVKVERASAARWDQIFNDCDYATYFHSREWAEFSCAQQNDGSVPSPLLVTFSDDKYALLPTCFRNRGGGLLSTYSSTMSAMPGGFIASQPLRVEHTALLVDHLLHRLGDSLSWRVSPYEPFRDDILGWLGDECVEIEWAASRAAKFASTARSPRTPVVCPDVTHALDLTPGFAALFPKQHAVLRKARKAQSAGVTVRVAEHLDQWQQYYAVYRSSVERWGRSAATDHSWELFQAAFSLRSPRVKLWVAEQHGKVLCGAICFYAKRHVAYWHGAALKEYFHLRPVNLLMLQIIKHACEDGHAFYDFNPSGNTGVARFKESFGAKRLTCPLVYVDSPVKRAARALLLGTRGVI